MFFDVEAGLKEKLFCPHCKRCLGECLFSGEGVCEVLKNPPEIEKNIFVHDMKCLRCKAEIYILMKFI